MGVDIIYQAVPDEMGLAERAVNEPCVRTFLMNIGSEVTRLEQPPVPLTKECQKRQERYEQKFSETHKPEEAVRQVLKEELRRVLPEHPDLTERHFVTRYWHKLHWLLSEGRREEKDFHTLNDWGTWAVYGVDDLIKPSNDRNPQRYTPPFWVRFIAESLAQMTEADLRANYEPERMKGSVYRFHGTDEEWGFLLQEFEQFRSFYNAAARYDEGVCAFTG